ncbi:MAG TPA: hypothetical protein VHV77_05200, partial [Pirellulales bacterium]|nr:hypothetical protein [Pirellulales bacterium]
ANSLLKTLEEPPPRAVVILVGTSLERQLPTIRSRSQIIRFAKLDEETIARLLQSRNLVSDPADARRIAEHSGGSLQRAAELLDADYWTFRGAWLKRLAEPALDSLASAALILGFSEAAGKESAARRNRLKQAIDLAIDFYAALARSLAGAGDADESDVATAVQRRRATWTGGEETAITATERSLEAREQLDRYAHQATVVECWLDELVRMQTPAVHS